LAPKFKTLLWSKKSTAPWPILSFRMCCFCELASFNPVFRFLNALFL
jgi:hypothetical protein